MPALHPASPPSDEPPDSDPTHAYRYPTPVPGDVEFGATAPDPDQFDAGYQFTPQPAPDLPAPCGPGGRYRLDGEIARGGMGVVYHGWDAEFGRAVAVKLLLTAHLHKPEFRHRFFAEARLTGRLVHPGVVPVYEVGETAEGRPFYTMRLVRGQTLAALLRDRPSPAEDRSHYLKVFETVCATLAYAHSTGVIHRDLKPANVMVAEFGVVKVMDWGVAKILPESQFAGLSADPDGDPAGVVDAAGDEAGVPTRIGRVFGTPAFMAPEQARGNHDQLDERTDVFGLGGLLCAIISGDPPYTGATGREVYARAARADLAETFDRLDACGVDPELAALCKRCLAAAPDDRPRSAATLSRELGEYLDFDLRRSERDLVRFFELSLDLFCIAGLDGYFRRVNANFARVLGYSTAELLNTPYLEFVHPDDRPRTQAEVALLRRGLPVVRFLNRYRDARGEYRRFEWTAKSLTEEGVIFAVARDVTAWVRADDDFR